MFSVSAGYFTKQNANVRVCALAHTAIFFFPLCEVSRLDVCILESLLVVLSQFCTVIRQVDERNLDGGEPVQVP